MKPTCVLFDLDGVLVDAVDWHRDALNIALIEHGFPALTQHDHETTYNGLPTRKKLDLLGVHPAVAARINDAKQRQTMAIIRKRCTRNSRLIDVFRQLKGRGFKVGVCSNAIAVTVFEMLERTGLLPYCDLVLGNESVDRNKPSPDIYEKGMALLGVTPQETAIVEDSPHGAAAATASGATVLRVKNSSGVTMALFEGVL